MPPDGNDTFPLDPSEWADFDDDGVGDNADLDDDGDGIPDEDDYYPWNPDRWEESVETDFGLYILVIIMAVVAVIIVVLIQRQRGGKKESIEEHAFKETVEDVSQVQKERPSGTSKPLPPPPPSL